VAPECGSSCFPLTGVGSCGGIARNITLPPNSSENSVGFLSNLRRIPSAERSRGASAKAQFNWSTALIGIPEAGSRRIWNTARPPTGTGLTDIGKRLERSQDGQSRIAALPLAPLTAYRRSELQAMYEKFEAEIEKLNQRVEEQACQRSGARLLMTHPGVGPITALATEVFLGDPARFADSKALASYVGMIPREYSSGGRQRLGGLSKQGNPLLRFLWGEAGAHAARKDPELQRFYRRKLVQKGLGKASVAVARKLGIRLSIMLRDQIEYNEFCRRGQKQRKSSDA
jgi:transposase